MPETFFPRKFTQTEVLRGLTSMLPTIVQTTADATIHTKGAYADLVTATSADASWVRLWARNTAVAGSATSNLLDLAIDPTGGTSYVVQLANIDCGASSVLTGPNPYQVWEFPLNIKAGSRIAARNQALITLDTVDVGIDLYNSNLRFQQYTGEAPVTYGAVTASSRGTSTAAGLSSAEGTWQIIGTTTARHKGLLVSVGPAADLSLQTSNYVFDIGTGAPGAEVAIVTDGTLQTDLNDNVYLNPMSSRFDGLDIPSGTVLSVRLSSNQANAQSLSFCLHGLT